MPSAGGPDCLLAMKKKRPRALGEVDRTGVLPVDMSIEMLIRPHPIVRVVCSLVMSVKGIRGFVLLGWRGMSIVSTADRSRLT